MSKAIVIVSFGTTNLKGLEKLELFEEEVRKNVDAKHHVCKAFTSSLLSNMLFNKHGKIVPRLEEVLFNLSNNRYKEVYIQPLHVIEGSEYSSIERTIKEYNYSFSKITLGTPLMSNEERQLSEGCNLIFKAIEKEVSKDDNIVLVGHGSNTITTDAYNKLRETFLSNEYKNVYIGTLEGDIKKEDIIEKLLKDKVKNITMIPILILPGNHIEKDIFGENFSWKSTIKEHNINVKSIKKALIEYEEIRDFYLNNSK